MIRCRYRFEEKHPEIFTEYLQIIFKIYQPFMLLYYQNMKIKQRKLFMGTSIRPVAKGRFQETVKIKSFSSQYFNVSGLILVPNDG